MRAAVGRSLVFFYVTTPYSSDVLFYECMRCYTPLPVSSIFVYLGYMVPVHTSSSRY